MLFVNDIGALVEPPVKMKLFADDCLIYSPIGCEDDQINLNRCLQALDEWCLTWDMEINYSKTTFTHIRSSRSKFSFIYHIGNHPLNNAASFKYLGVSIMHTLQWHSHVDNICSKANQKLYFLKKKLECATRDVKLTAYKTFVRPVLEYACVVWSPHQKVLKAKIERIQRLAVRFICGKYRRMESVTALLKSCELEPLEERRRKHRLKFLFKIMSGRTKINKDLYLQPQDGDAIV